MTSPTPAEAATLLAEAEQLSSLLHEFMTARSHIYNNHHRVLALSRLIAYYSAVSGKTDKATMLDSLTAMIEAHYEEAEQLLRLEAVLKSIQQQD